MIICITKIYCKRLRKIQDLHIVFTAYTRHAHNAPTALKKTTQRCQIVPTARRLTRWANAKPRRCFCMLNINAAAWRSMRFHSVLTAIPQRCRRLHNAHLGDLQRC